jgi:hypothetical protein
MLAVVTDQFLLSIIVVVIVLSALAKACKR